MIADTASKWQPVTSSDPCRVCNKPDWCARSEDGEMHRCQRAGDQSADSSLVLVGGRQDSAGGSYFLWRKEKPKQSKYEYREPHFAMADGGGKRAEDEILDKVYRVALEALPYAWMFGQKRGLSQEETKQLNYRSLGDYGGFKAGRAVVEAGLEEYLPRVPGFMIHTKKENGRKCWTMTAYEGAIIPVRNSDGLIVALKRRIPDSKLPPGENKKYRYLSSKRKEIGGAGPGSPLHIPIFNGDRSIIRITEGEVKADLATLRSDILTVSIPGVNSWRTATKYLRSNRPQKVLVALDGDFSTNPNVRQSLAQLIDEFQKMGTTVEVETWPEDVGKGIDDVLAASKFDQITRLAGEDLRAFRQTLNVATTTVTTSTEGEEEPDSRVVVEVTPHEGKVNRAIIAALATVDGIYQRKGILVEVRTDAARHDGVNRPADSPRIAEVSEAKLRSIISDAVRFEKEATKNGETFIVEVTPPRACVQAVHEFGEYPGIRHLDGIIEAPTLRPDGTILATAGYDAETRLVYVPSAEFPLIPEQPTQAEIEHAKAILEEVVVDFPFVNDEHRSAWLAGLFTSLARHCFDGPTPIFIVDASTRGSGKSLLADTTSIVATGRPIPKISYTRDDDETRKVITSVAMEGGRILCWDNLAGPFGNASLDAAATATTWKGRVLGFSKSPEFPFHAVMFATGNNVAVIGDTTRRVLICRLETTEENPEDRSEFQHADLLGWVRRNRPWLVAASLTILRGWFAAGKPQAKLSAWGSFQAWSDVIRQTIVWAGWPDPAGPRIELRSSVDNENAALRAMMDAMELIDSTGTGRTAAELIKEAAGDPFAPMSDPERNGDQDLRDAILEFCPTRDGKLPTSVKLGYRLRHYRKRVVGGRYLDASPAGHGRLAWMVKGTPSKQGNQGGDGCDGCDPQALSQTRGLHEKTKDRANARIGLAETSQPSHPSQPEAPSLWPEPSPVKHSFTQPTPVSSIQIKRPNRLLVRGPSLADDYCDGRAIPRGANEWKNGGAWAPIPEEWRASE